MSDASSLTRRALLASAAGGAAAAGAAETAAAAVSRVALAPAGVSFELVAKLEQDGADFAGFGYLTRIAGVPAAAVSSSPLVSETTAHFTFTSRATLTGRSHLHNLEILDVDGALVVYHRARPGADFSDPASFARGTRIAVFDLHLQSVLAAQTASEGSAEMRGVLAQRRAPAFLLRGGRRRFGARGARQRLSVNGWSERTSAVGPTSQTWVAGIAELLAS